MLYLAAD